MDLEPLAYAALVNHISQAAYAMRYDSRRDLVKAYHLERLDPRDIIQLSGQTSCGVTDADMMVAPYVKILGPLPWATAAELLLARVNLKVDGETVLVDEHLERFLVRPPVEGVRVMGSEMSATVGLKTERDLLGTCPIKFLPNGSWIDLKITNLPAHGGPVEIVMGLILFRYTTKAKAGCLFGVGTLADGKGDRVANEHAFEGVHKSASLVERTWRGDEMVSSLGSEDLDRQRAQLLGLALREEERARKARLDTEQALLEVKAELARAKVARLHPAPPPPQPKQLRDEAVVVARAAEDPDRNVAGLIYTIVLLMAFAGLGVFIYRILREIP